MGTSLANLIGGGVSGPINLIPWGALTAGSRTVKIIDNQKSGGNVESKDGVRLIAHFVNHASAGAGDDVVAHIWPLDMYMNNTLVTDDHMLRVNAAGYRTFRFDEDKGDSVTLTSPSPTDLELDLATAGQAAKFAIGDTVIVDPGTDRKNVFTVLSIAGEILQVDRQITSEVVAGDRAVNYQTIAIDLPGVPYLGWFIVVENLDTTNAPQFELEYVATAGSVLT